MGTGPGAACAHPMPNAGRVHGRFRNDVRTQSSSDGPRQDGGGNLVRKRSSRCRRCNRVSSARAPSPCAGAMRRNRGIPYRTACRMHGGCCCECAAPAHAPTQTRDRTLGNTGNTFGQLRFFSNDVWLVGLPKVKSHLIDLHVSNCIQL